MNPLDAIRTYASRMKTAPAPRSLRVLIVDDEEPVRKFVDRVLRDAGYLTLLAGDGPEALEVARKSEQLDLLVTDVMMPQMTGDELARRLRQTERSLKVLYLTGYADQLFKEKVTLWQDEAFLDKPCSVKGLQQAVSLLFFGRLEGAEAR
jgi:two-component system cell cycle sensor histidine kinase/response regulator CckA